MNPNNPYQPPENQAPPTYPPQGQGQYTPGTAQPQQPQYDMRQFNQSPPPLSQTAAYSTPPQQYYSPMQPPIYQQPSQETPTPPPHLKRYDKLPLPVRMAEWLKSHWWAPIIVISGILLVVNLLYQITYPYDVVPAGTKVDGLALGGMKKDAAITKLNTAYADIQTELYFGDATVPYRTVKAREIGIQVDNSARLRDISYPIVLRLIPTSIWWAPVLNRITDPIYNYSKPVLDTFALKNLGEDCMVTPKNASLKLDDTQFKVVPMIPGGKCNMTDFKSTASSATEKDGKIVIRTPIQPVNAPLTDEIARQLGDKLNNTLKNDMPLSVNGQDISTPSMTVKSWLTFHAVIPEQPKDGTPAKPAYLEYKIEQDRVRKQFDSTISSRLEKKPGVSKVSTTDFQETSRQDGEPGVMIDMGKTIASIAQFVDGKEKKATVTSGPVPPTTQYTRTYTPSDDGYRALIQQFPIDNPGTFGIMLQETGGKKPWLGGQVNQDTPFSAGGIEGVYAAYAALMGIEDGSIQHSDQIMGSKTVDDCVDAAIKDQDGDCISALTGKVGNATLQSRLRAIDITHTDFTGDVTTTTARDVMTFINRLENAQLNLRQRDKIETPAHNIRMRDGILQASSSARFTIGGSRDTSYNEAGLVVTKGKYSLVVLSKDSNAAAVAKLVRMIDDLRTKKDALKS